MDRYEADVVFKAHKTDGQLDPAERRLVNRLYKGKLDRRLTRKQKDSLDGIKSKLHIQHVKL